MRVMSSLMGVVLFGTVALVGAGCPSDDDDGGARADSGQCECPTPTALQVSYDKTSSQLGADNVQDAVDELAARPAEPPLAGRLTRIAVQVDNSGMEFLNISLSCPAATDVALGGGCGLISGATLTSTSLGENRYSCNYKQLMGTVEKPLLTVMCLDTTP